MGDLFPFDYLRIEVALVAKSAYVGTLAVPTNAVEHHRWHNRFGCLSYGSAIKFSTRR